MKYSEAIEIVKKKQYLIGKTIGGVTIDKIIICPTRPDYFHIFETKYYETFSEDVAITPFQNEDVEVAIIAGEKHLMENRLLIEWKTIAWAEDNLDE